MRLLLDTHAFLWWVLNDRRLSLAAAQALANAGNDVLISAASAWEIATKHRIGKLPESEGLVENMAEKIALEGFEELPIGVDDAIRAGQLPAHHNDPFDRMLIAQALARNIPLISNERVSSTATACGGCGETIPYESSSY